MINFLLFILLIFGLFIFLGISLIRSFFNGIFGRKDVESNTKNTRQNNYSTKAKQPDQSKQKKIIDADEGEYVEYEEIKD